MRNPVIVNRRNEPITSVEAWGTRAPPASAEHWVDGRSAKELAKAWITGAGPAALRHLLDGDAQLRDLAIYHAIAEEQTSFDQWPGGRRNHDLLIRGAVAAGQIVVGIEAKADESFGQTVGSYAKAAAAKRHSGKATNASERLAGLLVDVAGASLQQRPELATLRYQLLTGIAGTLAAAVEGEHAAFVVHEFHTGKTTSTKIASNTNALKSFMYMIFGVQVPGCEHWLLGPFVVPAQRWSTTPLWIGHLTTMHP
jgi:hypothetical protein